jgi:hypothetical protein
MAARIENINSDIINWAITRTGNSLEEFYAFIQDVVCRTLTTLLPQNWKENQEM